MLSAVLGIVLNCFTIYFSLYLGIPWEIDLAVFYTNLAGFILFFTGSLLLFISRLIKIIIKRRDNE